MKDRTPNKRASGRERGGGVLQIVAAATPMLAPASAPELTGIIVEQETNRSVAPGNKGRGNRRLGKQNSQLAHWLSGVLITREGRLG